MAREISDFDRTPSANRVHIAFFGRRNAGKSSLVNAVTGQSLSIVSEVRGTTTDPVQKAMELLPLGPVVIIDTPGIDDDGVVGEKRVARAHQILSKTDVAVLVVDAAVGLSAADRSVLALFRQRDLPFLIAMNKADLLTGDDDSQNGISPTGGDPQSCAKPAHSGDDPQNGIGPTGGGPQSGAPCLYVSAKTGQGVHELKEQLAVLAKPLEVSRPIITDRLSVGDVVILVTPIDASAPKGRLILPQVQTIRDILDGHATCLVTQVPELPQCLAALRQPPALVVTDSQAFAAVKEILPREVKLTSFSILFARYKGILDTAVTGAHHLHKLQDGDRVLISEGCTHHRQCEDIGTVKLPAWIQSYTGKQLQFSFTSGGEFPRQPEALQRYALIVHCGGCMLNQQEVRSRMRIAEQAGVPFTNYGTLIAQINGILDRSLEIFYV